MNLHETEKAARAELERLAQREESVGVKRGQAGRMANLMRLVCRNEKITEDELRMRARAGQL
jgi:hypothetical protein